LAQAARERRREEQPGIDEPGLVMHGLSRQSSEAVIACDLVLNVVMIELEDEDAAAEEEAWGSTEEASKLMRAMV
jgi:hypothetical protein